MILVLTDLFMALYWGLHIIIPYSEFDTRKNQGRKKWTDWVLKGILAFLIFGIIGGIILKILGVK
jgi:hypothetical protein